MQLIQLQHVYIRNTPCMQAKPILETVVEPERKSPGPKAMDYRSAAGNNYKL